MLRHLQTEGTTSSYGRNGDSGRLLSGLPLWQLCADKAHGGAVLLEPLAREAGSQTFEEVLSFSLYYPICGDDN